MRLLLAVLLCLAEVCPASGQSPSFYTRKLQDAGAVYLQPSGADDTRALQTAVDQASEIPHSSIVLLGSGHYQLTSTVYIWPGVRVIGYGTERPELALPPRMPGFDRPDRERVLFFFAGRRPRRSDAPVPDATPGTFYSALANVNISIADGNPGAVAVRARYAQHCFLAHVDFHLGDALAGIHEGGNVVEDVHFFGGVHAVWTSKPSPGWQFTLVDCSFDGQSAAAILEHEAGLTLIRPHFSHVPAAVEIETNWADELWIKDARLENISGAAFRIGLEQNPRTEINFEGVLCSNVPVFAGLEDSGKQFTAPATIYYVSNFTHGLDFGDLSAKPKIVSQFRAAPLTEMSSPAETDIMPLPEASSWANVHELGAKGDGHADDTVALQNAIAGHRALYFPSGFYIVRDTLELKPDTCLIGLHPGATQIIVPDGTPAFAGSGAPKALLDAPKGGSNVVIGLGLYTSGNNPRAVAALWKAGTRSMMNDVRFLGGHGTPLPGGRRENPYNQDHSADPNPIRHWDSQYPSLWVTDGGGGTFLDIWTPSTFARAGVQISDTQTAGRIYELSSEHHVHNELIVLHAAHWEIDALQTEEERGESGFCLPIQVEDSQDITFANYHGYRVISSYQPFPEAAVVAHSSHIRFHNFHCDSNSKVNFDSSVTCPDLGLEIRQHEFAAFDVPESIPRQPEMESSSLTAPGAKLELLASGFFNISGGVLDSQGNLHFSDSRPRRIYRWDTAARRLSTNQVSFQPANLAVDAAGNLLAAAYDDTVYAIDANNSITSLKPQRLSETGGHRFFLPVSDWVINRPSLSRPTAGFVSPDNSTVLPVSESFLSGEVSWGVKSSPQIRAFGLAEAVPGKPFYVTDESHLRTWKAQVNPDGSLAQFTLFAETGGESVATDSHGNVYIAAGQIYVYSPAGQQIETIRTPKRPVQLLFGPDHTLYISMRDSFGSLRMK